jgi:hypothetical protein
MQNSSFVYSNIYSFMRLPRIQKVLRRMAVSTGQIRYAFNLEDNSYPKHVFGDTRIPLCGPYHASRHSDDCRVNFIRTVLYICIQGSDAMLFTNNQEISSHSACCFYPEGGGSTLHRNAAKLVSEHSTHPQSRSQLHEIL